MPRSWSRSASSGSRELVVRAAGDRPAGEAGDRLGVERAADGARRVDVHLRLEHRIDGNGLAAGCRRPRLVDVADEHACAAVRELTREHRADGAGALHEDAPPRELGRAEGVLDRGADRVQRTAGGAAPAVSTAAGRAVDPRARLGDDVEIRRRDVHVAGRAVGAAERGDELAVAPKQALPRLAGRQLRHREHRLAAAARHPGRGHLPRHRPRQAHRVGEPVGRSGIDAQAGAAAGRAEHGRVDADEHPGSALGVVADDRVLSVPVREEMLKVHAADRTEAPLGYTPPPEWPENGPNWLSLSARGSARPSRAACARQGLIPGVLYGGGEPIAISVEERELRRALTGAGASIRSSTSRSTARERRTHRSSRSSRWIPCGAA